MNSVFTSIYFIGALNAELARSLPNYKDTYTPLGPRIVQQLFRTAIGEDAFRENLTGNLDAYKTLATTAGLLRPTDIGYSAFPGTFIPNHKIAIIADASQAFQLSRPVDIRVDPSMTFETTNQPMRSW